jgi:SAM-dependent methyltransferase
MPTQTLRPRSPGRANINTAEYWDRVYRRESESGRACADGGSRDYGPIHDAILGLVPDDGRVLDVACGPGLLCRKIRLRHPRSRVVGVDHSAYRIDCNRDRDRGLGIEYRCLDIRTGLDALDTDFDAACLCEIIEHLDDAAEVLEATARRLRPGGRLVVSCPHDDEIPDPEHVVEWGHDSLFHLLSRFGTTVSFRHFPPPYFDAWMLAWVDLDTTEATA